MELLWCLVLAFLFGGVTLLAIFRGRAFELWFEWNMEDMKSRGVPGTDFWFTWRRLGGILWRVSLGIGSALVSLYFLLWAIYFILEPE